MAKQNIKSKQGFTIIEVVLVLAIAGLIFLMVFVALPALQRSQRDTARRNDMSRVDTSLVQYQTNHNTAQDNLPDSGTFTPIETGDDKGKFPTGTACDSACQFVRDYMNSGVSGADKTNEFTDPNGNQYAMVITNNWSGTSTDLSGYTYNDNSKLESKTSQSGKNGYTIGGNDPFAEHVVYIIPGATCENDIAVKAETRNFAVLYRLEGAGVYCIDDQ